MKNLLISLEKLKAKYNADSVTVYFIAHNEYCIHIIKNGKVRKIFKRCVKKNDIG